MKRTRRDGYEYDGCERCYGEFKDEDDNRRAEEGYHTAYNLDLCEDCAGSFRSWIRCKCC